MKYFTFLATVLILLSCSQENTIDESLNFVSEKSNQENISETIKKYIGVFGHNTNKGLHGKIAIYKTSNGTYKAEINLVNGEIYLFTTTDSLQKNILIFKGESGSFSVDINEVNNPIVSEVLINSKTPGYIKLIKKNKNTPQLVVLGTYEETGNEANFYGNWDLFGEYIPQTNISSNFGPEFTPYTFTNAVITHRENENFIEDSIFEEYTNPLSCYFSQAIPGINGTIDVVNNTLIFYDLSAQEQISNFAGHNAQWQLQCEDNPFTYYDENCEIASSGTWSWNTKTGVINLIEIMIL